MLWVFLHLVTYNRVRVYETCPSLRHLHFKCPLIQVWEARLFHVVWWLKQRPIVWYCSCMRQFVFYCVGNIYCMNFRWSITLLFIFIVSYLLLLKRYKRVKAAFEFKIHWLNCPCFREEGCCSNPDESRFWTALHCRNHWKWRILWISGE